MNTIKRLILAFAATFGLVIATAGPAAAGLKMNHCEPYPRR